MKPKFKLEDYTGDYVMHCDTEEKSTESGLSENQPVEEKENGGKQHERPYKSERIHNIWSSMCQRCTNPNKEHYDRYGGRGIAVCEAWRSYKNFREWAVNNGYKENLTIDRIGNNKGYSPENCRWVTWTAQQNNRSSNRFITIDGESHTIAEWSKIVGIKASTIQSRLHYGWSEKDAVMEKRRIDENGKWTKERRAPDRDKFGRWTAAR